MNKSSLSVLTLVSFFFFAANLSGQMTGAISGHVVSAAGGSSLAHVSVIVEGTSITTLTGDDGNYMIDDLLPGTYELIASRIGFENMQKEIAVRFGEIVNLDFELEIKVLEIDPLTITATRSQSLLSDVPVPTEVITQEDIERSNAQNLGELLDDAPGVFIRSSGDLSALKSIGIRGSSSQQVLVLLDGQKLNDANGLGFDFSTFTPNSLEKIEIYRGGGSAIYGADALGGIINILTKRSFGNELSGGYKLTIGDFGTRVHNLNVGQDIKGGFYNLSYNRTDTDGDFGFINTNNGEEEIRRNADLSSNDFLIKFGYRFDNSSSLTFASQIYDSERGVAGGLIFGLTPDARQDDERKTFSLTFNSRLTERLNLKLQPYYNLLNNRFVDPDPVFPIDSKTENKSFGIDITQQAILRANNILTYGYTFRQDDIDGSNISDKDRTTHSVYVQDEIELSTERGKITLIPAVRFDDHSDYGSEFSPKLGFVFSTFGDSKTVIRTNIGRSFRAPGFSELFFPFFGNPDLKPEVAINFDLGLALKFPNLGGIGAEVTYFRNDVDDLIVATPDDPTDPFSLFSPKNVSKAEIQGIETKFSIAPIEGSDLINFEINYTWLDAVEQGDNPDTRGTDLVYRPSTLNILTHIRYAALTLNFSNQYVGKRFFRQSPALSLPGYWVSSLNAGVSGSLNNHKVFARYEANNLFDNQGYQVINGFPVPGIESSLSFGVSF